MQQIHQHIGEDNRVVTEDETLNDSALKRILLEDSGALDAGDPDDHAFSRPNIIRRLRKLREQEPERFNRIVSMRLNQRAAWRSSKPTSIPGAVMAQEKKVHPARLQLASEHHQALLESEALELIQPASSAERVRWDTTHWKGLEARLVSAVPAGQEPQPALPDLYTRWMNLIRRGSDSGGLIGTFEDQIRDRLARWLDLRQDERSRFALPAVVAKSFAVESPQAWHESWDPWMERFESLGALPVSSQGPDKATPSADEFMLGVALVPVLEPAP